MSLENTLREMMNEAYGSMVQQAAAKIRKEGTPETRAHQMKVNEYELLRGAIRRRIPSTDVARVVAKSDAQHLADLNPMPISRRERRAAERRTRTDREQGLKEHFKQRLQEGLLGLNEAIPLDALRSAMGSDPGAGERTRQRAAAAAAAAGSKPKDKPKDKPKGKPVQGASPATTPAPQIDLNALRASRQSG